MATTAVPLRASKLIMVTSHNNNKYYEMREQSDGTFAVTYGRVGGRGSIRHYPIRQWQQKYGEKIRKGYRDVTHLFAEQRDTRPLLDIPDPAVRHLIHTLTTYANASIHANYTVTADQVTLQQVEEAQQVLDDLVALVGTAMDPQVFNARLLELYTVIPRQMSDVRAHLVEGPLDADAVVRLRDRLGTEQDTLDVMAGQVKARQRTRDAAQRATPQTLLDALGLRVQPVEDLAEIETIRRAMGEEADGFRRAFQVTHLRRRAAFDARVAGSKNRKVRRLWHGSRNANWLSILENGLLLRPARAVITGKMFGYGLYFADRCRKSLNYTSLRGSYWVGGSDTRAYLALYDVHVGRPLTIRKHDASCYDLDAARLKERSRFRRAPYDSVFARGGVDLRNNEYIVYDEAQCTIRYLIEVGAE